jgi:hypothetical protein
MKEAPLPVYNMKNKALIFDREVRMKKSACKQPSLRCV